MTKTETAIKKAQAEARAPYATALLEANARIEQLVTALNQAAKDLDDAAYVLRRNGHERMAALLDTDANTARSAARGS